MSAKVGVLGGGGFGVALATAAARAGSTVFLHSRSDDPLSAKGIRPPDPELKTRIQATRRLADLADAELIFLAVPSQYAEQWVRELGHFLDGRHLMVHVSRGLAGENLTPLTEVIQSTTAVRRVGVLAGPLTRESLSSGTPGGGIVGTRFPEVAESVRSAIACAALRIYTTDDAKGVQVASAMVGILMICAGIAKELGLGHAATAMVLTRGLNEGARLSEALGGTRETFLGLAGVGDAMAGVAELGTDHESRPEVELGRRLALGDLPEDPSEMAAGHVEAAHVAARIAGFSTRFGLELPITSGVAAMLAGRETAAAVVEQLMNRPQNK